MNEQGEGPNRRQAVRMTDRILFSHTSVSQEKYETLRSDFEKGIALLDQEGMQDIRLHIGAQRALARLGSRDEDLAEFLGLLDAKVNLLLKETRGGRSPLDRLTRQEVSLSSGGMAFFAAQQIPAGEHLDLHLVLVPDHVYIYCLGEVVDCVHLGNGEKPYRISVKFILLTEEDSEKLIQHLFKLQRLALRRRRQEE